MLAVFELMRLWDKGWLLAVDVSKQLFGHITWRKERKRSITKQRFPSRTDAGVHSIDRTQVLCLHFAQPTVILAQGV